MASGPLTTIIDVYGPIGFGAIISGMAWIIREVRKSRRQVTDTLQGLQRIVSKHANDIQIMEIHRVETDKDVESLMRDFPLVRQNLAILARVVEDHEQWHREHRAG